jgi:hypothetical protein
MTDPSIIERKTFVKRRFKKTIFRWRDSERARGVCTQSTTDALGWMVGRYQQPFRDNTILDF